MLRYWYLLAVTIIFTSCLEGDGEIDPPPEDADVYVPVYADPGVALEISISDPKPIANPAKIFTYGQLLMVNIAGEGFHVVDNSQPSAPRPLFFINVPGNKDVAIKDGVIYADNYADIVVFEVDENLELNILERLDNVMNNQLYPPFTGVYFECVDPEKGIVVDWVKSQNTNARCFR